MQLLSLSQLETRLNEMSEDEFIQFQLNLMDVILEKKIEQGKTVFSEVENGLLNQEVV